MTAQSEQEFINEFGKQLSRLRKEKNLSQEMLAEKSGLHAVAITYIETGKRIPKLNTVYKLASGLNIEVQDLFRTVK